MRNLLTVFGALPWPVAGGWILFAGWAALQIAWYRRSRVAAVLVEQPPAPVRARPARVARKLKAADTIVDALPPIDLDSIANADISTRSQTVLGL